MNAQSTTLNKADKQHELHAFNLAIKSYLRVLERQPNNVEALSKLADCYRHLNRMDEAQIYYERAVQTGEAEPVTFFQYGTTLMAVGQYETAKVQFSRYARTNPIDGNQFVGACDFALARLNEPSEYDIRNEYINTSAADFGPSIYLDKVVYASSRIDIKRGNGGGETWTGTANNQLFISTRDQNDYLRIPEFLRPELRNTYNEGPVAYSPDGRTVVITKNNFVDGTRHIPSSGMELSLYLAEVTANGDWNNALPFPHNGPGFSNGFAAFSPDGQALYFASNRPDGFGGFDIYVSYRLGNSWSTPENLGAVVNSLGNEITPFFDGSSLVFASDWHKGFGGFDIFSSEKVSNNWSAPTHMGTGINSPRDDYGYVFDRVNNIGYFTSNRVGGKGMEDLYRVQRRTDNVLIQVLNASDRSPVEGATVDFTACGLGKYSTDVNGMYRLEARQGMNCSAVVSKFGYLASNFSLTSTGMNQRNIEVFLRKQGEEYTGSVVNVLNGAALPAVSIRATNQANGSIMEATTNAAGQYQLALGEFTSYIIRYSKPGYVDVSRTVRTSNGVDKDILGKISITPSGAVAGASTRMPIVDRPAEVKSVSEYNAGSAAIITEGYSVQVAAIATTRSFDIEQYRSKLSGIGPVYQHEEDGRNKVRVGPWSSKEEAIEALKNVKKKGYTSAFVVKQAGAPIGQDFVPKGVPDSYGAESARFDFATAPLTGGGVSSSKTPQGFSSQNYMIKLASYTDTRWFQEQKVIDIGVLEKRKKGDYTVMLLTGYQDISSAQHALNAAKTRGFRGAYLVMEETNGELKRISQ